MPTSPAVWSGAWPHHRSWLVLCHHHAHAETAAPLSSPFNASPCFTLACSLKPTRLPGSGPVALSWSSSTSPSNPHMTSTAMDIMAVM
ncbi:hypothetical protein T440DRAFT_120487 [Plenodomus tracheiphilus IPT5]|uniref:Uncharacterized protein n=1 Tax=Plenodomus tracheiphilus IPT5 TaxID=1408161 RepID=A0A6A7B371_9PLEO|nr:hypothetical protein T440DRAFT_120487 [Plenodomus tracheiphilus IPT5]